MPHQKDTSLGVELAPEKEPDRVASVELNMSGSLLLTLPLGSRSTAPPPPMSPPEEVQFATVTTILVNLNDPVIVNTTLSTSLLAVHVLLVSLILPESADIFPLAQVVEP